MQNTPTAIAMPKLLNSSLMCCDSPCSMFFTPAGSWRSAGSCAASRCTSPSARPASSTDSVTLRKRSSRSISDGPLPIARLATEASATLPFVPATRNWPMRSRSVRTAPSMRTRMVSWRCGRFSLGLAVA